jgi:tetratricopeptide (TPR) repeat protein
MRQRVVVVGLACPLAVLVAFACAPDPATHEYMLALRGDETGMSRQEQIAHLDRALALSPRRADIYETRAIYEIDLKRYDRALADVDRDIALVDRPYARFLRGLVLCESGRFAESLASFDTAIARQPANSQFYRGRSLARAACGLADSALADASHLVAAAPQQAESYYARGMALAGLGRDREALADFERAERMRPELVYVREASALAWARVGDATRAAAGRASADSVRADGGRYAVCQDPFRY